MSIEAKILSIGMTVDEALVCGEPYKECLARFAASDFAQGMDSFIHSEIERGTNLATLMITLARFQISIHASLAAQSMSRNAIEKVARMYQEMVGESYLDHVRLVQLEIAGMPA